MTHSERSRDLGDDVVFLGAVSKVVDAFCKNGHLRTDTNTHTGPRGRRVCRDCKADRAKAKHDKWKAANEPEPEPERSSAFTSVDDEADVPEPLPAHVPAPAVTEFVDGLDEFFVLLATDWTRGRLQVATRAQSVRHNAQIAQAMDTTTAGKIAAYVDALYQTALEGIIGTSKGTPTEQDRAKHMAYQVARELDKCSTALSVLPPNIRKAKLALDEAEKVFG